MGNCFRGESTQQLLEFAYFKESVMNYGLNFLTEGFNLETKLHLHFAEKM